MLPADRIRLHFGPYWTPRFRYGAVVQCELRGEVVIVGLSSGCIPWPIGQRRGTCARGPILYAGLARAVRLNPAVCHWWGLTPQTVTKYRRALDVGPTTAGSSELRFGYNAEEPVKARLRKAQAKSRCSKRDAKRRAKIAAAKVGQARPRHVIKAMRKGQTGKPHDESTLRKVTAAAKRRGTRPPTAGPAWTEEEERLLRELPAKAVAERTGRTLRAVYARRSEMKVADGRRR